MEPRQPTRSEAARAKPIAPCGDLFADSLDERFQRFHRANPMVFDLFLRFTLQLKAQGRTHYSAKAVMERIRWHVDVETKGGEGFKINNSWTSRYTRLLEQLFPEHAGFYEKRSLKT